MKLSLVPSNNGTFPGLEIEATSDYEAAILAAHVADRHGVTIEAKSGASVTFDAANWFAQLTIAKS